MNLHARFGLARTRRRQHARAFDFDDTHAAGVDRRQRFEIAERRNVLPRRAARVENRAALGDLQRPHPSIVELDRRASPAPVAAAECQSTAAAALNQIASCAHAPSPPSTRKTCSRDTADSIADEAVWPSPQIDASRMACPSSVNRASECPALAGRLEPPFRPRRSQQLDLAHCPHSTRHALAARFVFHELGDSQQRVAKIGGLVEHHHHAGARASRPPSRTSSNVSRIDNASGPTNVPAAPPSRIACSDRPCRHPARHRQAARRA